MKKLVLASSVAFASMIVSVQAADMERDLGLIVSGVVDQWAGVQVINNSGGFDDGTLFTSGTAGYFSLPLGPNLSIQNDFQIEHNENAFDNDPSVLGPRFSYQGAGHLSYRDPSSFLVGVFGGAGTANVNDWAAAGFDYDYRFVGGEAQMYMNDLTFYVQGGYLDVADAWEGEPDEGIFGRGVLRWFIDADSRLQFEGLYMNVDNAAGSFVSDYDVVSWGARYDTNFALPVVGEFPLYAAYRGTSRSDCNDGADQTDHTFMIGTSYSFSGTKLDVDRRGATLDTPNFGNFLTCYNGEEGGLIDGPLGDN